MQKQTIEDYLKNIYIIQKYHGMVYSIDIAIKMELSKATVSKAMHKLVQGNYITMDLDHSIHLTPKGEYIARDTYLKYRTFLRILVSLGVSSDIASQDACNLEHAISMESFDAISTMLEFAESW
jgi:Mn-dependent DtxR family transcriptional regulator